METPDTPWAMNPDVRIHKPKVDGPNSAAIFFSEFLKLKNINSGKLIEVGGGHGRNAVFFAEKGFEVHCVDSDSVPDLDLYGITPHSHNIRDFWHFEDNYFNIAFDSSCYHELSDSEKQNYHNEMKRVLESGGILLLSVPENKKIEFPGLKVELTKNINGQVVFILTK